MAASHVRVDGQREHVLLSCKGLTAKSKVTQHFRAHLQDGQRVFQCVFESAEEGDPCLWTTKSSQKIARHINLNHLGVKFRCAKKLCGKEFKDPNTYREHMKNHVCGFGFWGYGSKHVVGTCRNEMINRWRQRVSIRGKLFYRCLFAVNNGEECGGMTSYHMAMKRHIHGHVCPFRKNLKLLSNKRVIQVIKSDNWDIQSSHVTVGSGVSANQSQSSVNERENSGEEEVQYCCRRENCGEKFVKVQQLIAHENWLCPNVGNQLLISNCDKNFGKFGKFGKVLPQLTREELILCEDVFEGRGMRRWERKKKKTGSDDEFRSSSRVLNRIIKNKKEREEEKAIKEELICEVNPKDIMSEEIEEYLEKKPIVKQTLDQLKSFIEIEPKNREEEEEEVEDEEMEVSFGDSLSNPRLRQVLEKQRKRLEDRENSLRRQMRELEESIGLVEQLFKEQMQSDSQIVKQLKTSFVKNN